MGCGSSAQPGKETTVVKAKGDEANTIWLRILQMANPPDMDAMPVKGQFFCVVSLDGVTVSTEPKMNTNKRTQIEWVTGNSSVWNEMVPLPSAAIGQTVTVKVFDRDSFSSNDEVGTVEFKIEKLDTNLRSIKPLTLAPNVKTDNGKPATVSVKMFGGTLGKIINCLDAFRESTIFCTGSFDIIADLHLVFECFFSSLIPFECNRPAMGYGCIKEGNSWTDWKAGTVPDVYKQIMPDHDPTQSAKQGLELMIDWAKHQPDTATLKIAGSQVVNLSMSEFAARCKKLLKAYVTNDKWTAPSPPFRIGMVGGMGPLAGAVFSVSLAEAIPKESAVEFLMLSDPKVETVKHEKTEILKTGKSLLGIMSYLRRDALKNTCAASNTFHLMLQPSPPDNLLSIFDAVSLEIKEKYPGQKVGLMCTTPSMKHVGIGYGRAFEHHGLEFVPPTDEIQNQTMEGIHLVKNPVEGDRSWDEAIENFMQVMDWYKNQGVGVCALSCTEIPVVIKQEVVNADKRFGKDRPMNVVDSSMALVRYVAKNVEEQSK